MKKLLPLLMLLCAVSCSQTRPKAQFQEVSLASTGLATTNHPAVPADSQFSPARTNVIVPPPAEPAPAPATTAAAAPTNAPSIPSKPPNVNATNPPAVQTSAPAVPGTKPAPSADGSDEIIPAGTINFPATDLNQVLDIYASLVNRTVLRPANLGSPQITLKTQTPLTKKEAIQAFDAVLALNGISIINIGDKFCKVVPAAQANQEGAPTSNLDATNLPEIGQYVTHVVQLRYVKPSEIVPALQPFAKLNSILPIDGSQILILRDYTENVKRMLEMIAKIDVTVPSEFISEVIPIKYAKASEIADALNSLGAGGSGGGGTVGRNTTTGGATRSSTGGVFNRTGASGLGGGVNSTYGGGGVMQPGMTAQPGGVTGQQSFTDRLNNLIKKASTSGDLQLFGQMKMIADERSNSLLIFATREDMKMIKSVIEKLDVVLAQVLIETAILDVQLDKSWNYGISAGQNVKTNGNFMGAGSINNDSGQLGSLAQFFAGALATNGTSALPAASGLNYLGRYTGGIDVALNAAANDSRINVVQRPQILTTHATPGSIFVGSTVPYITSSYYGGAYGSPGSSYQQLQVGIGLTVTPYINQDGLVVMEVQEQIDEISGSTAIANVGNVPDTTSRSLNATVAVRTGDTIMLGGFVRNERDKETAGVPLLKDIPLLGALFQSKSDSRTRDELLVLMRPTVLKTPEIAAHETGEQKKRMFGVLRAEKEITDDEKRGLKEEMQHEKREQEAEEKAARKHKADSGSDDQ